MSLNVGAVLNQLSRVVGGKPADVNRELAVDNSLIKNLPSKVLPYIGDVGVQNNNAHIASSREFVVPDHSRWG